VYKTKKKKKKKNKKKKPTPKTTQRKKKKQRNDEIEEEKQLRSERKTRARSVREGDKGTSEMNRGVQLKCEEIEKGVLTATGQGDRASERERNRLLPSRDSTLERSRGGKS